MELRLKSCCDDLYFELFLAYMENLSNLYLAFDSYYDPKNFSRIYNYCKSLHTIQIDIKAYRGYVRYFEEIIGQMKPDLIRRNSPLKLVLLTKIDI
jgi:hypothetical protein